MDAKQFLKEINEGCAREIQAIADRRGMTPDQVMKCAVEGLVALRQRKSAMEELARFDGQILNDQ